MHAKSSSYGVIHNNYIVICLGLSKAGERWNTEEEEELTEVKEIGRSKWSKDLEEDAENSDGGEENTNVLSGILQAYGTNEKSVHWSDQVCCRLQLAYFLGYQMRFFYFYFALCLRCFQ